MFTTHYRPLFAPWGGVLLGLCFALSPSVAHASGMGEGLAFLLGLAALPVVVLLLLMQGLLLRFARNLTLRKSVGGLIQVLALINLGWLLWMVVVEIKASDWSVLSNLWWLAVIIALTFGLHLLSFGLTVRLFRQPPAQSLD